MALRGDSVIVCAPWYTLVSIYYPNECDIYFDAMQYGYNVNLASHYVPTLLRIKPTGITL